MFEDLIKEINDSDMVDEISNDDIFAAADKLDELVKEPEDPMVRAIWLINMFCELAEHFYKPYGCASGLIAKAKEFINDFDRKNKP